MDLKFEEKRCLILYLEFFNRCYNLDDERKYDVSPNHSLLVRHVEAQNIDFFLQSLGIHSEYGYTWDWRGPYSPGFQLVLKSLDKKGEAIPVFYNTYNRDRSRGWNNNYSEQLQDLLKDYFYNNEIIKISKASFALEDILHQEQGSEFLADIIYIGKTVMPGSDLPTILEEVNRRGVNPSLEIAEAIWKDLGILGIRSVEPKSFTRQRTLENEFCRGIR